MDVLMVDEVWMEWVGRRERKYDEGAGVYPASSTYACQLVVVRK
jgi:hypothetical protein